jgi:hypothetical protein
LFVSRGKTKSRSLRGPQFYFREDDYGNDGSATGPFQWYKGTPVKTTTGGIQITESDGNRWPPPKKGPDANSDLGSEFYTLKQEIVNSKFPISVLEVPVKVTTSWTKSRMQGPWIANCFVTTNQGGLYLPARPLQYNFPPDLSSSRQELVTKGTVAVAAVAPTNQIANASSAIGELLQDVPQVPGVHLWEARLRAIETLAAGGAEFLNVVFGISPTIDDMGTFLKGVHKVERVVDQFIRDSGRNVRRSFHFPKERSISEEVLPNTYSPAHLTYRPFTNGTSGWGEIPLQVAEAFPCYETIRTRVIEREIWFDGAFTYHLPKWFDTHSKHDRRLLMAKLFGAEPDLNTLWQLTPWSWAVDWISNAGSYVKNLQNLISYGTVLRYGYVMETTTITDTYTAGNRKGVVLHPERFAPPYPGVSPVALRTTVKKRIQANPFGFGLSWDGLSSMQQAIVAALGITRVAR